MKHRRHESVRKYLAKKGFILKDNRIVFEPDRSIVDIYVKSGSWKIPKIKTKTKTKRIKLADLYDW